MKEMLAGVVLIVVLGFAAFFYRNALEHPVVTDYPPQKACTDEAKVCPDGSAVGRVAPDCSFAVCAPPNVEDPVHNIAFSLPVGYSANLLSRGDDVTLIHVFDKVVDANTTHNIVIRDYLIPAGKKAEDVMMAQTMFEPSGNTAKSMKDLTKVDVHGRTFYRVTVERFEAQVHTVYYYPRINDVLRFEILEKNVMNWTDAKLTVETLPEHTALLQILNTLQTN